MRHPGDIAYRGLHINVLIEKKNQQPQVPHTKSINENIVKALLILQVQKG